MTYAILPPDEMIEDGVITLPLSKSISTRSLILDALSGVYHSQDDAAVAQCDDTRVMIEALEKVRTAPAGSAVTVDLDASGAAIRFLTAFFAATPGTDVVLTGCRRLCERPMKPLVDALRQCGAVIEYKGAEGFAPLHVKGAPLSGGEITIDSTLSSQFISALLMIAPCMTTGLHLHLEGEPVSMPYIVMTVEMMRQRGIVVDREPLLISVPPSSYSRFQQPAEGDWSAAAFWFEVSALSAGWITITNLSQESMQGDRAAAGYFECLGVTLSTEDVEEGVQLCPSPEVFGRLDLDLSDNPDLAPALAVTCCLIGVPFKFTGLQTLSSKECDRLAAICEEMDKVGRIVDKIRDFGLEWDGKTHPVASVPAFSSHGDHRIAMALAPVAVFVPGITIDGAECVSKSYPGYWEALESIGFRITEVSEEPSGSGEEAQ